MSETSLPYKIVIPSHQRPELIAKNPLLPYAHVVVRDPAVQLEYEKAIQAAGVKPPIAMHNMQTPNGTIPSLGSIRQWCLDHLFEAEDLFILFCDDDFLAFWPVMRWRHMEHRDAHTILAVIESTFNAAHDAGAGLFAWANSRDPRKRRANVPFSLRACGMGVFGIIDHTLSFDGRLYMMEDVDMSLLAMVKHRFNWLDSRWYAECGPSWAEGGASEARLDSLRREAYVILQRKYGHGIIKPMKTKTNAPYRFYLSLR